MNATTDCFRLASGELIRKHVPWTRVVADVRTAHYGESIELLKFLRDARENLVLKPSDEYGGTGVKLGWESSEADWDAAIATAGSSYPGLLDRAGTNSDPARSVPMDSSKWRGGISRHAGGFRTLFVPWKNERIF